jgi:hypothetical protein
MPRATVPFFALAATIALVFACGSSERNGFTIGGADAGEVEGGGGGGGGPMDAPTTTADVPSFGDAGQGGESPCDIAKANKSTVGCDYYAVDPGSDLGEAGSCFAAYIANTWTSDVTLTVTYNGQNLDVAGLARIPSGSGANITYSPLPNGKLPAGQMAILFLANWPAAAGDPNRYQVTDCPPGVTAGYTASEASLGTSGFTHAFHITSSAPVVAYDIYPYGGAMSYVTSATLLIPTSAWDTNYVAVDGYATPPPSPLFGAYPDHPFIEVVASQPGTTITISPTAAIVGGNGVAPTGQGVPQTYSLNAGDVLQILQNDELNGSPIQSNFPVGVWGGHSCMDIDVKDNDCDSAHQQLFPVKAMGSEYVAVKHRNRTGYDEQPPWRFVGAVDGTTLTYDPPVAGAPATLNKGEFVMFTTASNFTVKSQDASHPFYVGGHMTGVYSQGQDFSVPTFSAGGDPEWVNVIPPQQYLAQYIFFTDPTMSYTNIVVTRQKAPDGTFKDVQLDCVPGNLSGWQPVDSAGNYEFTRVDLVVDGAGVGGCNNGVHEIQSDEPFGVTVWGWDFAVSYAYPGGASVRPINQVVVPPQ